MQLFHWRQGPGLRWLGHAAWAVLFGWAMIFPAASQAQTSAHGVIRLIVPYGPGGAGDVIARIVAQHLGSETGATIVVENKPGGNGVIGALAVVNAAADGNTILLGNTTEIAVSPLLLKKPPYDSARDLKPVALAGMLPQLLILNPTVNARTIDELIALAKAQPNSLSYATAGAGSTAHIAGALLEKLANIKMLRVPYKGGAQAVADVLAGNVNMYFSGIPPAVGYLPTGKLIALGVAQRTPVASLPNVPPLASGALQRLDLSAWFGFYVPRETPQKTITALNTLLRKILEMPEVQTRLTQLGVGYQSMSTDEFSQFMDTERKKYAALLAELSIQTD